MIINSISYKNTVAIKTMIFYLVNLSKYLYHLPIEDVKSGDNICITLFEPNAKNNIVEN